MNKMIDYSCSGFAELLASAAPVPGGGGASAFAGALGAALGSMVGNLTLGKKKYEAVQEDIKQILIKAQTLREEMLMLVDKDAEVFEPLSRAYGLPKSTEDELRERDRVMEDALRTACKVPLEIMRKSLLMLDLHEELGVKGTRIAISDVGVGALFLRTALEGASLNVYINTKLMKDRAYADKINDEVDKMLKTGTEQAEKIYGDVAAGLKAQG